MRLPEKRFGKVWKPVRMFGGAASLVFASVFVFGSGCSDTPSPTDVESVSDKQAPSPANSASQSAALDIAALEILSRVALINPARLQLETTEKLPSGTLFSYRVLDPGGQGIRVGSIIPASGSDWPMEVTRVTSTGDYIHVETVPADWQTVIDAGPITFSVPLSAGSGSKDGVSWGPWRTTSDRDVAPGRSREDFDMRSTAGDVDLANIVLTPFDIFTGDDLEVKLLEGHFGLSGSITVNVVYSLCLDFGDWVDGCGPIDEISLSVSENMTGGLLLGISGDLTYTIKTGVPGVGFSRAFEVGPFTGEISLGLIIGIQAGLTDVSIETGFSFSESLKLTTGLTPAGGFIEVIPVASFEPVFEVISVESGFIKPFIGPEIGLELGLLTGVTAKGTLGATGFIKGTLEGIECQDWHANVKAGTDASAGVSVVFGDTAAGAPKFTIGGPAVTWPGPSVDLADFWGTGDFRVFTEMTGIDPDYNGYLVSIERSDPQADPVWTDILVNPIGVNDNVLWEGGDMCRKLILFGVTDCGLTAINHVIEIDDVMWNCAVQGESSRTLCLQFGAETTNTIDVSCISVFEALGNFVTESREQGLIRNDGIATSIKSKLMAAGNARDSGKPRTAANILRAAESQIATQSGKTIDAMIAQVLLDRIDLVVEYYLETPQVIGGDRTVDEPRFVGN